jgi:lysozyme
MVKRSMTQGQLDALTDFVFNLGETVFHHSRLLYFVNNRLDILASKDIAEFVHAGGVVLPSLVERRAKEVVMYNG